MIKENLLLYLDNCCFNRPYDNQVQERIKLETEAKLYIQDLIKQGKADLIWSFILDFENSANPFIEQKESIAEWKKLSATYVPAIDEIASKAQEIQDKCKLKPKDALHVASAIHAKADYLLTTDRQMLKTRLAGISIINPVDYVFIISEEETP